MKRSVWRTAHFDAVYFNTDENGFVWYTVIERGPDENLISGRIVPERFAQIVVEMMESAYQHGVRDFGKKTKERARKTVGELERELACGVNIPVRIEVESDGR